MKEAKWTCPNCGRRFSREGQSHYCGKYETVDEYIQAQDEPLRPRLEELRRLLQAALPEAVEKISWSMPTYWEGADRLRDLDVSKGTIRLSWDKPLPSALIADIARWCEAQYGSAR